MKRLECLDGLRGLLAVYVMISHMAPFAVLPGWIAQWREMIADPTTKIGRPRQVYVGEPERLYVPIDQR